MTSPLVVPFRFPGQTAQQIMPLVGHTTFFYFGYLALFIMENGWVTKSVVYRAVCFRCFLILVFSIVEYGFQFLGIIVPSMGNFGSHIHIFHVVVGLYCCGMCIYLLENGVGHQVKIRHTGGNVEGGVVLPERTFGL